MSMTATFNPVTGKTAVAYSVDQASFYLCWSDTATSDYTALINAGKYDTIMSNTGTWTDNTPQNYGGTRYYYAVEIYDYSLIGDATCTIAALSIIASDFTATASGSSTVNCSFTLPGTVSSTARIYWQYSTVDPASAGFSPSSWVTIDVTDVTGNSVS